MSYLRLRHVAQLNPPSPRFDELDGDAELSFVPLECVWPRAFDASQRRTKASVSTGYTRFETGDILVPKITPTFQADRTVIADGLLGDVAAGTTELHVVRPTDADRSYVRYLLSTHSFLDGGEAEMIGVAGQKRVPEDWLLDQHVPVADRAEQRRIAAFLDAETERIDQLIATKTRMIEVLDERRWATVAEVVSVDEAKVPLRRCFRSITDGPFGSSLTSDHYVPVGCRVVRLGNIGRAEFLNEDEAYIDNGHATTLEKHRISQGDLLIAGLGDQNNHVGRACVAPDLGDAIVKADCYAAKVDPSLAYPPFLAMVLSSPYGRDAVAVASRGTTRNRINLDIANHDCPWRVRVRGGWLVGSARSVVGGGF